MTSSSQAWKRPKSPSAGARSLISHLQPGQKIVPEIRDGTIEGKQIFADSPALWKRMMHEWPMGAFAEMASDFLVGKNLLCGDVLELGAGVGSCSTMIADHVNDRYIRSDIQPFLLRRQMIRGHIERYDFDDAGPWTDLDTIFAVNALHCAREKRTSLSHLARMLRSGGKLVLAEGNPITDDNLTPWALNAFFGLFKGWWDRGGYLSRVEWLGIFEDCGFDQVNFAILRAGDHDLGGLIWGAKP